MSKDKLPPLPEESFDGEKERTEIIDNRCEHRDTIVLGGELHCTHCTASWSGSNIHDLKNLLKNRT